MLDLVPLRRPLTVSTRQRSFAHVAKLPAPELRPSSVQHVVEDILYLYREPCRSRGRKKWGRTLFFALRKMGYVPIFFVPIFESPSIVCLARRASRTINF